jgi:hypothetical protein
MRLKQFLLTERRSKEISRDEAVDILFDKCGNAVKDFKNGYKLYRGLYKPAGNYISIDPKSGKPRKSAYAKFNYYTLFIDNLPSWRQYPKRSQSIICTTAHYKAVDYTFNNMPYAVFPYDGAKLAVAPDNDIFESFKIFYDNTYNLIFSTGDDFNKFLNTFLFNTTNVSDASSDWNKLKKTMKSLDKKWDTDTQKYFKLIGNDITGKSIKKFFKDNYKGDLLKMFDTLLSPKYNDFRLTKKISQIPDNREVWTDNKCIMIHPNVIDEVIDTSLEYEETYAPMDFIPKLMIKDIGIDDKIIRTSFMDWLDKYIDNGKKLPDTVDVKLTYVKDYKYIISNNFENALAIIRACFKRQKWVKANVLEYTSDIVYDRWEIQPNKKYFGLEDFSDEEGLKYTLEDLNEKNLL